MIILRSETADARRAMSRRDWLSVSLAGGASLAAGSARAANLPKFGQARSCILLYLFGGPSHIDTWDMKPDAPDGIRGEFKPIATNVPGLQITEHMPLLARQMDRFALIRSLTHGDHAHGSASHTMLTGRRPIRLGEVPPDPDDSPHYGAILSRHRPALPGVAPFVALPWRISTSTNVVPGQDGGFLGQTLSPLRLESREDDPFGFRLPFANLSRDLPLDRLVGRRALWERLAESAAGQRPQREFATIHRRAFETLLASSFHRAFRLEDEPAPLRQRYGDNVFGQSVLLARRLTEAGVGFVTVYWPDRREPEAFNNNGVQDSVAVPAWDTHGLHVGSTPNFPRLRDHNLPPLDRALTALIEDLENRGRLDETLIVVTGEFGRTPRINRDAGRDHYGNVFSALLAGGGTRGGAVYGSSDRIGAYPKDDAVSPGAFAATLYHLLGVDPASEVVDRLGRPHRLADGQPIAPIIA